MKDSIHASISITTLLPTDDDDGGSSTSTELCDDEEEDKLSDLEADPGTGPRPATTSPRLETVKENSKTSPKPAQPQPTEQTQDKQTPVTQVSSPSVPQKSQTESVQTQQEVDSLPNTDTSNQITVPSESQQQDLTVKEEESEVFLATEPPLWDFKSSGIPLEDLLAGKNLTAAEIIARIPFPSDVSFMKQSSEGASQVSSEKKPGVLGSSSPSSIQHNVTPEKSPVDSPVPKISSPDIGYEPLVSTKPSPNASPSKSLSSTPSPKGSPINKSSKSPSKSPTLSPKQSQDHYRPAKWSLVGLPPVSPPDTSQDTLLIPPKSPKITVEDEKSNIFEIHTGVPGLITSFLKPFDEENGNELQVDNLLETASDKSEVYPSLPLKCQEDLMDNLGGETFTPETERFEVKDNDTSVLTIISSENLETVYEHPGDNKISPDITKEKFKRLEESYGEIIESGADKDLMDTDSLSQKSFQTPESSMFDAICQKLKENVIKAESDISELQTDFATKSGLCLTMDAKEDTPTSEAQTSSYDEKSRILDEDVEFETVCTTSTCAQEATLSTSSWISSLTMSVKIDVIPSTAPNSGLATPAATSSEDGQTFVRTSVAKEASTVTTSVEDSDSPVFVTPEAGSPSDFISLDSRLPTFAKEVKSETGISTVDGSDLSLLSGKMLSSLATPATTTLNYEITGENTVVTNSISPTATFNTTISPETYTKEFPFPCVCSGFSAFTTTFDSENVVSTFDTKDLVQSVDYQSFPLNKSETTVSSPTATQAEQLSTILLSVISGPSASVTTTSTSLTFSSPQSRDITHSADNIDHEISPPSGVLQKEPLKSIIDNGISDFKTPLEKDVLSLIGPDQAAGTTPTLPEAAVAECESPKTAELPKEVKLESEVSPRLSLEERISALLNLDERLPMWTAKIEEDLPEAATNDKITSPTATFTESSNFGLIVECEENDLSSIETSGSHYSHLKSTQEEEALSPTAATDRDSSLSASLEGRISFFTNDMSNEQEEEVGAYGRLTEDKEDKSSEDTETETETDFFNGKDLSSEAIRQRLWRGVKSLSLDADITLDPDVFCFLIQQSSRHRRNSKDGQRKMPKRRNSEVALQELVKENTEIIERILRQKSIEGTSRKKTDTTATTPGVDTASEEDLEKKTDLPVRIESVREKSEIGYSADAQSHKITKSVLIEVPIAAKSMSSEVPTAAISESHDGATDLPKDTEVSQAATQSKVVSPQSSRTLTIEQKHIHKKEDSSIARSPIRPITFNPFPTRNVPRQPKEVAVKLGLYSPTKKTSDSSPT